MSDITILIGKIKKLLSLAGNNPNPAEAALAAAKAQELIDRYKIEAAQLEDQPDFGKTGALDQPLYIDKTYIHWHCILGNVLARANQSRFIISSHGKTWGGLLYGTEENGQLIRYLYTYISLEITRLATLYNKSGEAAMTRFILTAAGQSALKVHYSFCVGAVLAIRDRLAEVQARTRHEAPAHALMVLDRLEREADTLMRSEPGFEEHDGSVEMVSTAATAGYMAGKKIPMGTALGAGSSAKRRLT